jgi:hypothetical protein
MDTSLKDKERGATTRKLLRLKMINGSTGFKKLGLTG